MHTRSLVISSVAVLSIALNVAFGIRLAVRHQAAVNETAIAMQFETSNALDNRIYLERSARFGKLPVIKTDVLFAGDSIAGILASDLEDRQNEGDEPVGWSKVTVHARCVPGLKTAGLLSIVSDLKSVEAKTIFIMCGNNDLGTRTADEIATTYGQIVDQLRDTPSHPRIIFLSLLPRTGLEVNKQVNQLNAALSTLAADHHAEFLDLSAGVTDASGKLDSSTTQDGIHPSAAGCLRIERLLASKMQSTS